MGATDCRVLYVCALKWTPAFRTDGSHLSLCWTRRERQVHLLQSNVESPNWQAQDAEQPPSSSMRTYFIAEDSRRRRYSANPIYRRPPTLLLCRCSRTRLLRVERHRP